MPTGFFERIWEILTTNMGTKFISILVAFVLWFVVLGSRNVEVTKELPVEVITSSDLVVANDVPDKISFRLSGPKAFLRAILDRRDDPIRINVSNAKPGLITYRFFSDNIHVPIGVKVLSINPTAILIKLEPIKRREVPVKVELKGIVPEGFRISKTTVEPPTVKVLGAETRIEGLFEVSTVPIDVNNLKQTTEKEAILDIDRLGMKFEGIPPKVTIHVEPTLAANFKIKNVEVRVLAPTGVQVAVEQPNITILVRAGAEDLKKLDRSTVYAVVNLRNKGKGEYVEVPQVNLPENVGLVKVIPEKVHVKLF
ncbi:hypothetical protein K2X30_15050 [bacterium]|jgi:YbbR domain-containing protein|nr:hypothetical protein [bacterium]